MNIWVLSWWSGFEYEQHAIGAATDVKPLMLHAATVAGSELTWSTGTFGDSRTYFATVDEDDDDTDTYTIDCVALWEPPGEGGPGS